jgi:glycosyltransferase involved in cell wall biosynthesis
MRILIHDFSGHAFTSTLSRELARRGHEVAHVFSSSFLTPQGPNERRADDPDNLQLISIKLDQPIDKGNLRKRRAGEIEHGRRATQVIREFKPDLVLSGNTPLDAQRMFLDHCEQAGIPFLFWVQDLIGQAAVRILRRKVPVVGGTIGKYYQSMENRLLERSRKVVVISEDFRPHLPAGVMPENIHVVENWAVLDEISVKPRQNEWAAAQGASEGLTYVYSGTLGMKHNPELLVQMAKSLQSVPGAQVIVISGGAGLEFVAQRAQELNLGNLKTLPFQPFEQLENVLGTADVLMAILEPDAGVFSVPSKVLSYLCAGRALLLAVPPENLAARIVAGREAGIVVPPTDPDAFVRAGMELAQDADRREQMGRNARAYAEETFDIRRITDRFLEIFESALAK